MRRSSASPVLPLALVGLLVLALGMLALLQYRWIARVSEAERQQLRSALDAAATRVTSDVDTALNRVHRAFPPPEEADDDRTASHLASQLSAWRENGAAPRLVREILVVTRGRREEGDVLRLRRLDEGSRRLVDAPWEPALESLRGLFASRGRIPIVDGRLPGLVLPVRPVADDARRDRPREEGRGEPPDRQPRRGGGESRRPPRDHVVVRLDLAYIKDELLAKRIASELGGPAGPGYSATVALAAEPATPFLRVGSGVAAAKDDEPDLARPFFSVVRPGDEPEPGHWVLAVHHPAGSLERAVAGARRRNLAVGIAVLALLGVTAALVVFWARRAQGLARQQLDFVAGISHELRTPLAAIRSAGQNLADGIVDSPEKVRRYGSLIEREGRRLTEMVGRVLAFAGLQSGSRTFASQPVDVRSLVEGVLADFRWVAEERPVTIEAKLAESLPPVRGDATALRQALANLVDNALKYGGTARWIGVEATALATARGEEVRLRVSDRGIGIRKGDLSRLFEPFFRGHDEAAAGIGGSGLGLAVVRGVVEAHGGRVSVESQPGRGSTFTIHLPAIAAEEGGTA